MAFITASLQQDSRCASSISPIADSIRGQGPPHEGALSKLASVVGSWSGTGWLLSSISVFCRKVLAGPGHDNSGEFATILHDSANTPELLLASPFSASFEFVSSA